MYTRKQDEAAGFAWLTRAATNGDPDAQYAVALALMTGDGFVNHTETHTHGTPKSSYICGHGAQIHRISDLYSHPISALKRCGERPAQSHGIFDESPQVLRS